MRAFVFTDTALAGEAGRFVWLAMNTEKKENAPFRRQYAIRALPTYFVVDPDSEAVLLSRVGGATTPQLVRILDAGRRALAGGTLLAADSLAIEADRLYGAGEYAKSIPLFDAAIAAAPAGWPAYDRTAEADLFACTMTDSGEAGARTAIAALDRIPGSVSAANIASLGLDLAVSIPAENPARSGLLTELTKRAEAITRAVPAGTAADDVSAAFISLLGAADSRSDSLGYRNTAERWSAFLDSAAAAAPTADARAVFDSHRLSAYLELGTPEKAIPMLTASEAALPGDYNPPYRLAVAYRAMGRYEDALAAARRALKLAYGPRSLGIYRTTADIEAALGDTAAAVATLDSAVAAGEALPDGQRPSRTIAALKAKREAFAAPQ